LELKTCSAARKILGCRTILSLARRSTDDLCEATMRVMVIVKATEDSEAGGMPPAELLADMGAFNQALIDAGIFVDAGGVKESRKGARVAFSGKDRTVAKGPFPNISELAAGYWIWRVKDLDEAIECKRCPNPMPGPSVIEIREMFELGDFDQAR
jgi:hypothetical protein